MFYLNYGEDYINVMILYDARDQRKLATASGKNKINQRCLKATPLSISVQQNEENRSKKFVITLKTFIMVVHKKCHTFVINT